MLTGQKYDAEMRSQNTIVPAVETDQPPLVTSDDRQPYQTSLCDWPTVFLDQLVKFGHLTQEQRDRAELIDIPDNSMDYPLLPGGQICIVLTDADQYKTTTGVVFVDLKDGGYTMGRIALITDTEIVITRENPEWPTLTLALEQIEDLYKVTHFTNIEVR